MSNVQKSPSRCPGSYPPSPYPIKCVKGRRSLRLNPIARSVGVIRGSLLMALCFVISLSVCQAQTSFGTILGFVHDQAGLAVSGAPVQILNTDTGVVTTVKTQPDGNYTAINLIPGLYVVSASSQGFAKAATPPTALVVNQNLRLDLVLHPGTVTETVQVTTEGTLIETDSPAISEEISQREVSDLPLTSGNFIGLAVLSPAVVADPNGLLNTAQTAFRSPLSGGGLYVGGGRGASNGFLIDGVEDNDPAFQTPTITPPVDDIQDVRLMSKDYSAEFSGSADQINVATKSGGNSFHGTIYEYLQNDALNAVPDFASVNPVTGRYKPELRYNRFGVAAGGPMWIPHVVDGRNKLFFFADYQGLRSHSVSNGRGIYPTSQEVAGDFSALCTTGFTAGVCNNPAQQLYQPGTTTPISGNKITSIDPVAAKIISAGVLPTANASLPGGINYIATLNAPDNIDEYSVRIDAHLGQKDSLFARFSSSGENRISPGLEPWFDIIFAQAGKNMAVDYTHIFTNNFINDLRFGLNRPITTQEQQGGGGTNNVAGNIFNGITSNPIFWGAPYFYFSGYSEVGGDPVGPVNYTTTGTKLTDAVTWIHGPHTVQGGLYIGKVRYKETDSLESRGLIEGLGLYTSGLGKSAGNSIADLLLGDMFYALEDQGDATVWYNSWEEGGFLQDTYKVGTRFTLDLGIRYDYSAPMREEQNRGSIFDPTYPGGRLLTANMAAVVAANSPLVAYTPARDITAPNKANWSPRLGISYRPFGNTVIRTGYGIYYDSYEANETFFPALNAPFASSYSAEDLTFYSNPVKLSTLFPAASVTPVAGTIAAYTLDRRYPTPYVQQWNLDVEHQLPGNMVLEIGYIGSEGTHLQDRREANQKKLITPGTPPGALPYPNFVSILEGENAASSNYNALIARFEKRFSHGFSLLANYTYAKGLGTSSATASIGTELSTGYMNGWDKRADYGPLAYDITHSFVFSPIWELPFGRGRMLASNAPAAVNALIGGWQVEGIFTAHTGLPFSIVAASDTSGTGSGNPRAQVIGNPWGPHAANLAFNTAAFAAPAKYTFGNSSMDMMRGLGLNNSDFSLIKNTKIHESLALQLRFEFFNVFNQADLGPYPGYTLATPSTFGQYVTIQHAARTLQIGGKIDF